MKYAGLDLGTIEATFNLLGGLDGAARLRRGELVLVEAPKPEPPPEPVLDFIIRVDHSVKLTYPDWMKKDGVMHPEFEATGPAEYDLRTIL
jgi:hypothetical protein